MVASSLTILYAQLQERLDSVIHFTRAHLRPVLRWSMPVERVRGVHPDTGRPVTVIVAGSQASIEYFVERFAGESAAREPVCSVPLLALPRVLSSLHEEADLIIARAPRPSCDWLFEQSYLHAPEAVGARLEVPENPDDLAKASTRARRNIARIRKNGLTWSISRSASDFERFYDKFYVPFIKKRFGSLGVVRRRQRMRMHFRQGCILWIEHQGHPVVGALMRPSRSIMRWIVMGTAAGEEDPVKLGALSAIYFFGAEHTRQSGLQWFDLGVSRPCLGDGVLSHKKSWGGVVVDPSWVDHDVLFRWNRFDENIQRFLVDNPLIFREGRRLSGIGAIQKCANADALARGRKIGMPGLRRLYVVDASRIDPAIHPAGQSTNGIWLAGPGPSGSFCQVTCPSTVAP